MDNSIRSEIIKVLGNKNIFPKGYKGYSRDYIKIIKGNLSQEVLRKANDIDHSIRQVLETAGGYSLPDGTQIWIKKVDIEKNYEEKYILCEITA